MAKTGSGDWLEGVPREVLERFVADRLLEARRKGRKVVARRVGGLGLAWEIREEAASDGSAGELVIECGVWRGAD